ncbi:MAG TPA: hypothetical protein VIU82_19695 [Bosea sp. (in: a-proteobacteria)]
MAISDFEQKWTVASLAIVALLAAATLGFQAAASATAVSASGHLIRCADEHAYLKPAARAAICLCFVDKAHHWSAVVLSAVSSAAANRVAMRAAFHSCVASEFALNQPGEQTANPLPQR